MFSNDGEKQPNSERFNGVAKTMFPAENSHHSPKSTHDEDNKSINLEIFLCALNEKKRLTIQNIENSIIWCLYKINYKINSHVSGKRTLIDLTLQDVFSFLFLASLISKSFKFFCFHLF